MATEYSRTETTWTLHWRLLVKTRGKSNSGIEIVDNEEAGIIKAREMAQANPEIIITMRRIVHTETDIILPAGCGLTPKEVRERIRQPVSAN